MSVEENRGSALVEIAKRNGEFSKNYGVLLGAALYAWTAHISIRPRPVVRPWWVAAALSAVYGAWKLWLS